MTDVFGIALALVAGICLGLFYFGGLWLTVRNLSTTNHPALLTMGSFLGRMAITLAGFYLVMGGGLGYLLASLVGFVLARQASIRFVSQLKAGEHS
jgi:F1F0 ATPase subunit 2